MPSHACAGREYVHECKRPSRLRFWLLIHKVFSKAVIYPIGLSLNAFEWDQSNYNLKCLMVKGENKKKTASGIKQPVPSCGCAFENLCEPGGVCLLFCAELNWQYLQGLNIYLVCNFSHWSWDFWNSMEFREVFMRQETSVNWIKFDKLCWWVQKSNTLIALDGCQSS